MKTQTKNRLVLIAVLLLFAAPLLIAFALNSHQVTPGMVDEVCTDLKIDLAPAFTDLRRQPMFPSRPRKA